MNNGMNNERNNEWNDVMNNERKMKGIEVISIPRILQFWCPKGA